MQVSMASRAPKPYYTETEAARSLGIPVEDFRVLIKRHIVDREEDLNNVGQTTFHASDLLILRMLIARQVSTQPLEEQPGRRPVLVQPSS